jgi:hypothetical protein
MAGILEIFGIVIYEVWTRVLGGIGVVGVGYDRIFGKGQK